MSSDHYPDPSQAGVGALRDSDKPSPLKHLYEYTPEGPTDCSPVALCGYEPKKPTTSEGGWREREQERDDCAVCFEIARERWGKTLTEFG